MTQFSLLWGLFWARWFLLTLVVFQGTTWGGKGSGKGISVLAGRIVPFCVLSRALLQSSWVSFITVSHLANVFTHEAHGGGAKCDFCYLRDLSNWGSMTGLRDKSSQEEHSFWRRGEVRPLFLPGFCIILSLFIAGSVSVIRLFWYVLTWVLARAMKVVSTV